MTTTTIRAFEGVASSKVSCNVVRTLPFFPGANESYPAPQVKQPPLEGSPLAKRRFSMTDVSTAPPSSTTLKTKLRAPLRDMSNTAQSGANGRCFAPLPTWPMLEVCPLLTMRDMTRSQASTDVDVEEEKDEDEVQGDFGNDVFNEGFGNDREGTLNDDRQATLGEQYLLALPLPLETLESTTAAPILPFEVNRLHFPGFVFRVFVLSYACGGCCF